MSAADPREHTDGYRPPEGSEDHPGWILALKFGIAMGTVAVVCALADMNDPTTGVIAAAFLVGSPPVQAVRVAALRILGMFVGAGLGVVGAYWGLATGNGVPPAFFAGFGLVVGALASLRSPLTYAAVIGVVVATSGAAGDASVPTVALETSLQLVIGCAVAVAVIWTVEKLRAMRFVHSRG